jgi:preprotein translocase subunit YajC
LTARAVAGQKDPAVFISNAYAADAAASSTSGLMGMLPLVLMFVVMYFLMIRPQMKKQKETQAMLSALAKGDEVVTQGGLLGKISKLGDTFVSLEVAPGTELQVQRVAIIQVLPKGTLK